MTRTLVPKRLTISDQSGSYPVGEEQYVYEVAGTTIRSSFDISILRSCFAGKNKVEPIETTVRDRYTGPPHQIVTTIGWIGGANRTVAAAWSHGEVLISVSEIGSFSLSLDGGRIIILDVDDDAKRGQLEEALVGPPLILFLACSGIWCLHASGIEFEGRVVLFVGDSGAGKSTIAANLSQIDKFCSRIADDVVPVAASTDELLMFPRFPQLKLPANFVIDSPAGNSRGVDAILVLERDSVTLEAASIDPITSTNAMLAAARHTVSTRLLDRQTMSDHLAFCASAARSTRFAVLRYPSGREGIERAEQLLRQCF